MKVSAFLPSFNLQCVLDFDFHLSSVSTTIVCATLLWIYSMLFIELFIEFTSSISDQRISTIAMNPTGDWIGFGCSGIILTTRYFS